MLKYSVVIPSYNEAQNIGRCLKAVVGAAQAFPDLEVLVIDNGSTDRTREIAAELGARIIRPESRVSIAALRNMGGHEAKGDVILFLDADMEPPESWLATIDGYFGSGKADVLGFVERIPPEAPWFARVWSDRLLARRPQSMAVDYLPGRNICVRRAFFEQVSGFDGGLRTSEDKDFVVRLKRAGASVISDPSLDLYHWGYEKTFREFTRKEFWRQGSHVAMIRRHGAGIRLLRFPLLAVLHILWPLAIVAGGLLWQSTGWLLLVGGWFVPSALTALGHKLSRWPPLRFGQFVLLYWYRFVVAGASVLAELIARRQVTG